MIVEKYELAPVLSRVYIGQRTQLEMIQQLTLSLGALKGALEILVPGFAEGYAKEFEALRDGELGQKIAKDLQAFDQILGTLRSGQF
jgi:hypothetical protein